MGVQQQHSNKEMDLKLAKSKPGMSKRAMDYSLRLSGCVGVGVLGAMIDGPAIVGINFIKSPVYFWKGWKVTMAASEDLGPALTSTMMFAWPFRVMYSMGSSVVYSLGKGLKAGVVAYQEKSYECGFKHIVAAISEYDEYTNDVILLGEGSCLPRPAYKKKKKMAAGTETEDEDELLVKATGIQELKLERLMEFMWSATGKKVVGRRLIEEGFIALDMSIKLTVESVGLIVLGFLLKSAEETVARQKGVVVYDPLETLERQIRDFRVKEDEKECLTNLVLEKDVEATHKKLQEMQELRKGTLQAFGRRIRGVSRFISGNKLFKKSYPLYVGSVLFE